MTSTLPRPARSSNSPASDASKRTAPPASVTTAPNAGAVDTAIRTACCYNEPTGRTTPTCTTKPSRRATEPSGQIAPAAAHPPWPTRTAHAADPPTPTREVRNDQGVAAGRRDDARPINLLCFSVSLPPPTRLKSKSVLVMVDGHQPLAPPHLSAPSPRRTKNPTSLERGRGTVCPRRPTYKELAGYGVEAGSIRRSSSHSPSILPAPPHQRNSPSQDGRRQRTDTHPLP